MFLSSYIQYLFELCLCLIRGLKAYLSKWKGRGFDVDVKRLVLLLEAGTAAQVEQMVNTEVY